MKGCIVYLTRIMKIMILLILTPAHVDKGGYSPIISLMRITLPKIFFRLNSYVDFINSRNFRWSGLLASSLSLFWGPKYGRSALLARHLRLLEPLSRNLDDLFRWSFLQPWVYFPRTRLKEMTILPTYVFLRHTFAHASCDSGLIPTTIPKNVFWIERKTKDVK